MTFIKSLFQTKSISDVLQDSKNNNLKKTLGAFDLVLLGIGCVIGTGIFVLTGIAAAKYAGPAISISFFLAGVVCIFAGLAYAELAAMVPVSGSAYTYSYVVLGEFIAWLVAWGLILEYTVAASTVAAGWSGYFTGILSQAGIHLPDAITKIPSDESGRGIINLPAVMVAAFVGILLIKGTKESVIVNRILVAVKLGVIFLFIFVAAPDIKMENYAEFFPFGWQGVGVGTAAIFFSYLGFDSVATTAEECKNPKRDLPIGIIGSLLVCAVLYVVVSLVLTGITHYSELNSPEPMAYALRENGSTIGSALVGTGAVAGMIAVLLMMMYGQSRIFYSMSRDGLIPGFFSKIHKKFSTPYLGSLFVTVAVCSVAGFTPIERMGEMSSMGTLFAFMVVSFGVLFLRIKRPDLERPFRCPAVFLIAPAAVSSCGFLIYKLLEKNCAPFIGWFIFGIIVYFLYSKKRSVLSKQKSK